MDFLEDLLGFGDRKRRDRDYHDSDHDRDHGHHDEGDREDSDYIRDGSFPGGSPRATGPSLRSCPGCAARISAQARFCDQCGLSLPAPAEDNCPGCGSVFQTTTRFCPGCGLRRQPT